MKNSNNGRRFLYFSCIVLFGLAAYTSLLLTYTARDKTDYDVRVRGVAVRRRWQDVAHLQGLLSDMHRELNEAVAERDEVELQLKQILETEEGKHMARWTTIVHPIKSKLPARLRSTPLLGCDHIDAIQMMGRVSESNDDDSTLIYRGLLGAEQVIVKSVNPSGSFIKQCSGEMKRSACLQMANYRLMREIILLQDLQSENVLKILGRCVRSDAVSTDTAERGITVVTENAQTMSLERTKLLPLEEKIAVIAQILKLLEFLNHSPLGSLRIESFHIGLLVMAEGKVKLGHVSHLTSEELGCGSSSDCVIALGSMQPTCTSFRCVGYNRITNLKNANEKIFAPILWESGGSDEELSKQVVAKKILDDLRLSNANYGRMIERLYDSLANNGRKKEEEEDDDDDSLAKRMSVFSELDTDKMQDSAQKEEQSKNVPLQKQNFHRPEQPAAATASGKTATFKVLPDVDFPGKHDYNCLNTKARWGCAIAVQNVEEAKQRCLKDERCKAFVVVPHQQQRVNDWMTAFLKDGASGPVRHQGTVTYVKVEQTSNDASQTVDPFERVAGQLQRHAATTISKNEIFAAESTACPLAGILSEQYALRRTREKRLMEIMGWSGMTDSEWLPMLRSANAVPTDYSKASETSNGVGVQVEFSSKQKGWFKVETDVNKRHIAQVAFFYLDRLLGMFKTVPTTGRIFSLVELQQAHFPSKLGVVKAPFAAHLKADGSLPGAMSAWIRGDVDIKRKVSLRAQEETAWAVTRLTQEQKDDLEYVLMMWLGGLSLPSEKFLAVQNHMVHLDSHLAMKQLPLDVFPYFNNCQFPRHLITILRFMHTSKNETCRLSKQLVQAMQTDPLKPTEELFGSDGLALLDKAVEKLLDLVEKCIERFGESIILYD